MKLSKTYINIKDKWWGLPLIPPSFLLPFLISENPYAFPSPEIVVFFSLPLAFMLSLMLFFGWAALPGIVLAIFWRRYP
ncbi:sensor domain-containing phosphodiesterase, partial [Salmonella enterica subsp. enterica serovar Newport]